MTSARDLRIRIALVKANVIWRLVAPIRSFLARRKSVGGWLQPVLDRVLPRLDGLLSLVQGNPVKRYETWIAAYDTIDDGDLLAMRDEQSQIATPSLLSLVVPVAHLDASMLNALAQSLLAQVHERWEVCFVGQPSVEGGVDSLLSPALSSDPRCRPLVNDWDTALRSAAGDFVLIVDPRIVLRPHSLFLFARTIERHQDAVLVYADEDVIDEDATRSCHYFKPDWNEALLRSQNYLGGLVAVRRSLALEVGVCREELDGDRTWDLFLRMTAGAPPGTIHHLPFILSHRRAEERAPEPHDGAERELGARAHEARLARLGRKAQVEPTGESSYRTRYELPQKPPSVSVIVPTTSRLEFLRPCVEGILNRTSFRNLEVIIVVNEIQRDVPERRDYLEAVAAETQVRILVHEDRPFNFSWANNWAVGKARGELLCFLNDDTDVIGSDWLSAMVAQVLQDRVGGVGAMLLYPNDRIQHAGVILGAGGLAGHTYKGRPRDIRGYHDRALVDQDVSCVTAACMLVRRDVFLSVGGFDESLAIAFNDVDLCLRLRKAGWRIVWTPSAELYHKESVSIGRHDVGEGADQWTFGRNLISGRWSDELMSDPHYNPSLSLDALQLWEPAFPPRVSYPWRAASRA